MNEQQTVSLALGSGGARGFAHIGVIEVLEEEGFSIQAISGSSMGACVGGVYCAGKLTPFKEWIVTLNKRDTVRLLDFTMSTQGVIKGKRVLEHIRSILGDIRIEDFNIPYTAVATDVNTNQEVWMRSGDLYSVIRASSAIPTLVMPSKLGDRLLIDGGVLDPLPIAPLMPKQTDLVVAVNINAHEDPQQRVILTSVDTEEDLKESEEETKAYTTRLVNSVKKWLNMNSSAVEQDSTNTEQTNTLSYLGMLNKSFDLMQDRLCEQSIEIHKPDLVIDIPRHVATTLEFYRAEQMVEEGRIAAKKAISAWKEKQPAL